jgi:hypothetical protein
MQIRYRPNFHLLWPRPRRTVTVLAPSRLAFESRLRINAAAAAKRYAWPCRPFPPRDVMTSVPSIGDALRATARGLDGRDKFVPASTNLGF